MGADLNRLIALGGTGIKSPVVRYQEAKAQNQAEQMNRLSMLSTRQGMDINNQKMQMLQQENSFKGMASAYDYVNSVAGDDPVKIDAAIAQIMPQLEQKGIPAPPQGMSTQQIYAKMKQAKLRVDGFPEAPKTRTVFDGQEKVNQEFVQQTGKWKEVGRGIPSQQTGLPSDFTPTKGGINKVIADRTEANVATKGAVAGMQELARIVSQPEWQGGLSGNAISTVNSLTSQWKQLTNTADSVIDENGNIDTSKISPKALKSGWIERAARRSDEYKAALIELAYAKSRAVGNTRITDKDFDFAKDMLASGGDRKSILNNLKLQIDRTAKTYNDAEDVYAKRYGSQGYKQQYFTIDNSPFTVNENNVDQQQEAEKPFDVDGWLKEAEKQ